MWDANLIGYLGLWFVLVLIVAALLLSCEGDDEDDTDDPDSVWHRLK